MKPWIKTLLLTVIAALLGIVMPEEMPPGTASCHENQGQYTAQGIPGPITDEYGFLFNAPVQIPALTPNKSSRLVTPAKYRVSTMRPNTLRRTVNRLSANIYTPIAATGRLIIERMSAPLRHTRAVHFYVLELCRLLC